jgi:hypothetical protein
MQNSYGKKAMPQSYRKPILFLAFILSLSFAMPLLGPLEAMERDSCLDAITLQLSRSLDHDLEQVSESIKALADEYVLIYEATPPMAEAEKALWMKHALEKRKTISFHPFSKGGEPAFQAPVPAYLFYNGRHMTPNATRALKAFVSLAPLFKATYRTFHYSWVYMATVDEAFFIYPYLPLDEAVNNLPPTKQGFYRAADFAGRRCGWQKPYLDLVGAGMMVTVSYPVYSGEELLGVISRDITLTELSSRLLKPILGPPENLLTLIMDKDGLAIATSRAAATKEISRVNTQAGSAVLHYRTPQALESLGNQKAVASSNALFNEAGEKALAAVKKEPNAETWQLNVKTGPTTHKAAVARIPETGWLLITIDAQ